ncbi:hypothetical protein E4665_07545 [Sporolactobacillus shoreae]|uniref:Uncharacterized protein n=1 Tax=Sporolactobacillus shoreae TaxID=1465501 RepID=A0A4Z0GRA2_9BACL|nr:hypothetical protein [Sporolactobacillus shoreae]TGA98702.1 hypothetical protein E4665_07545 [Sporolactobacillus shoreae]
MAVSLDNSLLQLLQPQGASSSAGTQNNQTDKLAPLFADLLESLLMNNSNAQLLGGLSSDTGATDTTDTSDLNALSGITSNSDSLDSQLLNALSSSALDPTALQATASVTDPLSTADQSTNNAQQDSGIYSIL